MSAELDGEEVSFWSVLKIRAGQQLAIGKISSSGSRAYLLIQGEFMPYLSAVKINLTLGQFGGHAGRALRSGDVLHFQPYVDAISMSGSWSPITEDHKPLVASVIPSPCSTGVFHRELYSGILRTSLESSLQPAARELG